MLFLVNFKMVHVMRTAWPLTLCSATPIRHTAGYDFTTKAQCCSFFSISILWDHVPTMLYRNKQLLWLGVDSWDAHNCSCSWKCTVVPLSGWHVALPSGWPLQEISDRQWEICLTVQLSLLVREHQTHVCWRQWEAISGRAGWEKKIKRKRLIKTVKKKMNYFTVLDHKC